MNFHVFVLIITIVFYIILRFYKHTVENEKKNGKPKSNFIYILFVPFILYLTRFMYVSSPSENVNTNIKGNINTNVKGDIGSIKGGDLGTELAEIKSESLLSMPFPESSMSISS